MKRKVIQLAEKTLVVSLPSKWARNYNIRKGDEVEVTEAGSKLSIGPQSELMEEKTELDVRGLDLEVSKRTLGAIFKAGYDEVNVTFEDINELNKIQEVIREEFIGFEVMNLGKGNLTAKNITTPDYREFDTVLKRLFMVIITMAEESFKAAKEKDKDWLNTIIFMDKDVNKYSDFCRRILNKRGYTELKRTPPVYYIVEQLEKIGDDYRDLCKYFLQGKTLSKEGETLFESINDFFRKFYDDYYKFELKKINQFFLKRGELRERFEKAFEKSTKEEIPVLFKLYSILNNVFDMNGPLISAKL